MHQRHLQQFLALAESLHFGQASLALNISASALSRNIQQLEHKLDAKLFERDNRSVRLTNNGRLFESYARQSIAQWQAMKTQISESGPVTGELSLYCSVTASYSILFDLLNQFRPLYPHVEIKLQTGNPEEALGRVLEGKEDVAIAAHPKTLPSTIVFKPVRSSPLVFIAPSKHTDPCIPDRNSHANANWADVPMILANRGIARSRVDAWFRQRGFRPRVYAQVAGNEAIVSMVSLGLGVGVVPRIVLDNSPLAARVVELPVTPPLQPFDLGLFTLRKNRRNPIVNAIWEVT